MTTTTPATLDQAKEIYEKLKSTEGQAGRLFYPGELKRYHHKPDAGFIGSGVENYQAGLQTITKDELDNGRFTYNRLGVILEAKTGAFDTKVGETFSNNHTLNGLLLVNNKSPQSQGTIEPLLFSMDIGRSDELVEAGFILETAKNYPVTVIGDLTKTSTEYCPQTRQLAAPIIEVYILHMGPYFVGSNKLRDEQ